MATAGRAVIFAGGIVVIAILGLAVAGVPFMTAAAVAIAVVVLIMVVSSVTLLPAFLGLAGHGGWPRAGARAATRRWAGWAGHVSRHPRAYAAGGAILLLALAAPALDLRLGNPDEGHLPRRAPSAAPTTSSPRASAPAPTGPSRSPSTTPAPRDAVRDAVAADPGIASVGAARAPRRRGDA